MEGQLSFYKRRWCPFCFNVPFGMFLLTMLCKILCTPCCVACFFDRRFYAPLVEDLWPGGSQSGCSQNLCTLPVGDRSGELSMLAPQLQSDCCGPLNNLWLSDSSNVWYFSILLCNTQYLLPLSQRNTASPDFTCLAKEVFGLLLWRLCMVLHRSWGLLRAGTNSLGSCTIDNLQCWKGTAAWPSSTTSQTISTAP